MFSHYLFIFFPFWFLSFLVKHKLHTPCTAEAPHVPYGGSKHYLPTLEAPIKRFFRPFSSVFTFLSPNSDFHHLKLRLSRGESSVLKRAVPEFISSTFKCKHFSSKTILMQLCSYSLLTFILSVFALVTLYILNYIYYCNNIYNL